MKTKVDKPLKENWEDVIPKKRLYGRFEIFKDLFGGEIEERNKVYSIEKLLDYYYY